LDQTSTSTISDAFEAIYVINLDERKDRIAEISPQLNQLKLSLTDGSVIRFSAMKPTAADGFPSVGARGCFLSHLGVLKDAKDKGFKSVLILEDDCDFAKNIVTLLPPLIEKLVSSRWSIFYGGYLDESFKKKESQIWEKIGSEQGVGLTHCVGFNNEAIELAVNYLEAMLLRTPGSELGGPMHVDGAYSWFRRANPNLTTMLAVPSIAFQRPSRSDIHDLKLFDRIPVLRSIAGKARKLRRALIR
jgi:glycosyl transferase, family 25